MGIQIVKERRMSRVRDMKKACRILSRRMKKVRPGSKKSRNTRVSSQKMREKFGVKIPNATKESLMLDRTNGDNKWHDSMQKEQMTL